MSAQMSRHSIEGCRHRGLAVLLGHHAEVQEIMYMQFGGEGELKEERCERTKSDATNSKAPSSRYSTATKARRAVFDIQNLFRITICINFGREVFLAE